MRPFAKDANSGSHGDHQWGGIMRVRVYRPACEGEEVARRASMLRGHVTSTCVKARRKVSSPECAAACDSVAMVIATATAGGQSGPTR